MLSYSHPLVPPRRRLIRIVMISLSTRARWRTRVVGVTFATFA